MPIRGVVKAWASRLRLMSTTTHLLPGFGRPLNYVPTAPPFGFVSLIPSVLRPWSITDLPLLTTRESTMLSLMDAFTNDPEWYKKIYNEAAVAKWRNQTTNSTQDITERMFNWCLAELRDKANAISDLDSPPPVFVCDGSVYKSDTAVSQELLSSFRDAVTAFKSRLSSLDTKGDQLQGPSKAQILDVVDPSLFPLVYGRSRILTCEVTTLDKTVCFCEEKSATTTLPIPPDNETVDSEAGPFFGESGFDQFCPERPNKPYSRRFQWLPSEVDITGIRARVTTYINNLHPIHERRLYELVEELITVAIPQWELTLAPHGRDEVPSPCYQPTRRIVCDAVRYDPDPERAPETEGPQQEEGEHIAAYMDRRADWVMATRRLVIPDAPETYTRPSCPPPLNLKEKYGPNGLQVIVKMTDIRLTPDQPDYEGEVWHASGQVNEHIVATARLDYDVENITPAWISFRHTVDEQTALMEIDHERYDPGWLEAIYGVENESPAVQVTSHVEARAGRLVTFSNFLQHRTEPFTLVDHSKPGHRKMIELFLVDPNIKIISTAHVPPQQPGWCEGHKVRPQAGGSVANIQDQGGLSENDAMRSSISIEEMKVLRKEMLEERRIMTERFTEYFEFESFSV